MTRGFTPTEDKLARRTILKAAGIGRRPGPPCCTRLRGLLALDVHCVGKGPIKRERTTLHELNT
jgi:hypothetical protein